jgi:hypothetical protein
MADASKVASLAFMLVATDQMSNVMEAAAKNASGSVSKIQQKLAGVGENAMRMGDPALAARILSRWAPMPPMPPRPIPVPALAGEGMAAAVAWERQRPQREAEQRAVSIDYDRLGRAVAENVKIPELAQVNVSMDERGFEKYLRKGGSKTRKMNRKFSH